jgi:hypothetical protein
MPDLLMAVVTYHDGSEESEPITVEREGDVIHVTLFDGVDFAVSADDLRAALAA